MEAEPCGTCFLTIWCVTLPDILASEVFSANSVVQHFSALSPTISLRIVHLLEVPAETGDYAIASYFPVGRPVAT